MGIRIKNIVGVLLLFASPLMAVSMQPGAFEAVGAFKIAQIDANLTGKGVNIGLVCRSDTYIGAKPQNDYKPDISHNCFKDLKINFYDNNQEDAGISNHSTAIASILAGDDNDANFASIGKFSYEGPCPDSKYDVYEFRHFIEEYVFSGGWPQDDVLTMSLGWASEDWWTRGIDRMADKFGILIIASIGNGKNSYDLPLYPAAGSNVLAVGVVDSADSLSEFGVPDTNHSTAGPTLDGRCKPDVVAPGNCLVAAAGTKDSYRPSGDYSSFAAPVVTGVASILIQKAKNEPSLQFGESPFMRSCIMKSIILTSAKKLPGWHKGYASADDDREYPLDFEQGSGMVDGSEAFNVLTAGIQQEGRINPLGWDVSMIEPNYSARKIYRLKTDGFTNPRIAATLIWNRVYEDEYPFNPVLQKWADLQLEIVAVDANSRNLVDSSNSPVDNVEHIWTDLDPNSEYEIVISHSTGSELPASVIPYAVSWMIKESN